MFTGNSIPNGSWDDFFYDEFPESTPKKALQLVSFFGL
jgi:hypothetical protein